MLIVRLGSKRPYTLAVAALLLLLLLLLITRFILLRTPTGILPNIS
jgi:hypothetical protein